MMFRVLYQNLLTSRLTVTPRIGWVLRELANGYESALAIKRSDG